MVGLSCCMQSFSSCGEQGLQFVVCTGFSLQWLLLWNTGSRHMGFSSCGMWALLWVWHTGLVALWHVESSPTRDQNGVPCIARQFWTTETPEKTGNIWFWCHREEENVNAHVCVHACICVCMCVCAWHMHFLVVVVQSLVVSNSLRPHGVQHTRLPCPSKSSGVCSNSNLPSWWRHPTISSFVAPFSYCPQTFPASASFLVSWLFTLGGSIMLLGFSKGIKDSEKVDTLLHEGKVIQGVLT